MCHVYVCVHVDLGLVAEDKPTEFSCRSLSIIDTIGTMCSVVSPIKEVSLFSGGFIHFSTRDNVQIRKVSVFWSSLIERFHCITLSSSK